MLKIIGAKYGTVHLKTRLYRRAIANTYVLAFNQIYWQYLYV